jgi:hypothetical protein
MSSAPPTTEDKELRVSALSKWFSSLSKITKSSIAAGLLLIFVASIVGIAGIVLADWPLPFWLWIVFLLLAAASVAAFSGLFLKSDLPPHWKRGLQAAGLLVTAIATVLAVTDDRPTGGPGSEDTASPSTPSQTPDASPTPSASPTASSPTPTPDPTPSNEVRRSTGDNALTLSNAYEIDMDSMDRDWGVHYSDVSPDRDLAYDWGGLNGAGDMAIVSGPVKYETCQDTTAYKQGIDEDELENGLKICVRTSEKRYAFVTIKKIVGDRDHLQLGVTVWDPKFE